MTLRVCATVTISFIKVTNDNRQATKCRNTSETTADVIEQVVFYPRPRDNNHVQNEVDVEGGVELDPLSTSKGSDINRTICHST